jgi:hypothetical protein
MDSLRGFRSVSSWGRAGQEIYHPGQHLRGDFLKRRSLFGGSVFKISECSILCGYTNISGSSGRLTDFSEHIQ